MMSRPVSFVDLLPTSADLVYAAGNEASLGRVDSVKPPDAESAAMQDRPDDFRDSFYYRAIRTRIGAALGAQYDLAKPLPDRINDLLARLDQADTDRAGAAGQRVAGAAARCADDLGMPRGNPEGDNTAGETRRSTGSQD
jgi:hypothetical protein